MPLSASYADVNTKLGAIAFVPEVSPGVPNYKFRATGGSGTTVTVDVSSGSGTHDQLIASAADDFFNGLQVVYDDSTSTSALQGLAYDITDFAISGGTATFTVSTQAATPSSGDTFRVYGLLQASEDVSIDPQTDYHERNILATTLDPATSLAGVERASGSIEVHLPGLVTPSADGSAAGFDRYSALMAIFGSRTAATGEAVSGSSSTTTQIDVTDASLFAVNDEIMISGQIRYVTAVDTVSTPDNITVHRALSAAPADATVIYRPEKWTPYDSGHQPMTLLKLEDDALYEMTGAQFNLKYGATYNAISYLMLEWQGSGWTLTSGETLPGTVPDKAPIVYKAAAACEMGGTEIDLSAWEWDAGHDIQMTEAIKSGVLPRVRGRRSTLAATWRMEDLTPKNTWEPNVTEQHVMVSVGNAAGDCICISGNVAPAQNIAPTAEVGATRFWDTTFGFYDNQDSSTAKKPILSRY